MIQLIITILLLIIKQIGCPETMLVETHIIAEIILVDTNRLP